MTGTVIVQVALAPTLPPLSDALVAPGAALTVAPPAVLQVVVAAGDAATVIPDGRLSVSDTPVRATAPAAVFAIVIVSVDVPPPAIGLGLNALVTVTFGGLLTAVVGVLGSQASPVALVHNGSPPPDRFAELLPPDAPTAAAATLIGTVIV